MTSLRESDWDPEASTIILLERYRQSSCIDCATFVASNWDGSYRPFSMERSEAHGADRRRPAASRASVAVAVCSFLVSACGSSTQSAISGASHLSWDKHRGDRVTITEDSGSAQSRMTSQILSAWLAAEKSFDTAALAADADQPDLAATTIAPQLTWSQTLLQRMKGSDQIARGAVNYGKPEVVRNSADSATVTSCVYDAEIVVSVGSGRPVPGIPGQVDHELFESIMRSTTTGWKLSTQTVGVDRCG